MEKLKTNEISLGLDQTFRNDLVDNFKKIQDGVDGQYDALNKQITEAIAGYARDQKNYFPNGDLLIPHQTDPFLPLNGVDLTYVNPTDSFSDDRSWVQVIGHNDDTPYKGVRVKLDLDTFPARYWRPTELSFILRNDDTSDTLFHIEMNVFQETGDPIVYNIADFIASHDVNTKVKVIVPAPVSVGAKKGNIHSVFYNIWTEKLRNVNFHITGITGKFHSQKINFDPDPQLAKNNLLGATDVKNGSIDPYVGLNGAENLIVEHNVLSYNWVTASGTDDQTVGKGIGIYFKVNPDYYFTLDKKFTGLVRTKSASNLNYAFAVTYLTSTGNVTKTLDDNIILGSGVTKLEYTIPSPQSLGIDKASILSGRIQLYTDKPSGFTLSATEWSLKNIIQTIGTNINSTDSLTLPTVKLYGKFENMTGDTSVTMQFKFNDHGRIIEGYSDTKWQGDSSLRFPKKNLRLKLYTDETLATKLKIKPDPRFPKDNKFNLKANYIQTFSARNLVTSELFREVVSSRQSITPYVAGINNYGAIVGFPVLLYINDTFYGLMTFNTTKDIITQNLPSKNPLAFAIQGESGSDANRFKASTATLTTGDDKLDFTLLGKDKVTPEIQNSVNNLLKFVNESSDEDFVAHIAEHYDVDSAIDWILMVDAAQLFDLLSKNVIHLTEDGTKFYAMLYDLDGSFANGWQGTDKFDPNNGYIPYPENKLFSRIIDNFKPKIKARYAELVSLGIFTTNNIQQLFKTFIESVGQTNYELDQNRWPDNPATKLFTYDETMDIVRKRMNVIKKDVNRL